MVLNPDIKTEQDLKREVKKLTGLEVTVKTDVMFTGTPYHSSLTIRGKGQTREEALNAIWNQIRGKALC